ncbi:MAG TPA: hypothetical protein VHG91_21490 [Longimicrobium sp.]|nr:hypothetical protein [Longimicrobium sp.]
MTRSLTYLRRGLLGLGVAASLGFGAAQALATPQDEARGRTCPARGYDYAYASCRFGCDVGGYCRSDGTCQCGYIP